ncbi:hypothetical protein GGR52DRAFT_525363 [Hypoxylon sp. FL1284]|nr:hypothetical protein GGR52DRAFT_525363 [Hypoxylon sp. FL1284]
MGARADTRRLISKSNSESRRLPNCKLLGMLIELPLFYSRVIISSAFLLRLFALSFLALPCYVFASFTTVIVLCSCTTMMCKW